ncbi:hypothetical protein [Streptomyces sp. 8L]|uniref:hypothetical protein n=1 Tax=Streptomyces sp. 8L TaxID=2877242 RepID=UPI001CD78C49|nr:hypothetical protein [Streptomyces sp. 8L]MCA1217111.1 hypothetical protein [Streptomyces sp. 8L]
MRPVIDPVTPLALGCVRAPAPGRMPAGDPHWQAAHEGGSTTGARPGDASHKDASGASVTAPGLPPHPEDPPTADSTRAYRAIVAAWAAGRRAEAYAIVAAREADAAHRDAPLEAARWTGVRAHLAVMEGEMDQACALWLTHAGALLLSGLPAYHPDVRQAVDNAHASWHAAGPDTSSATQNGQALATLRRLVPGPPGATEDIPRRLARTRHSSSGLAQDSPDAGVLRGGPR